MNLLLDDDIRAILHGLPESANCTFICGKPFGDGARASLL
jgi:hypothetical protein